MSTLYAFSRRRFAPFLAVALGIVARQPLHAQAIWLDNGLVRARFGQRGLESLDDRAHGVSVGFTRDEFTLALGSDTVASDTIPTPTRKVERARVTYRWTTGSYGLQVVYEVRSGWRFVSKQVRVVTAPESRYRVHGVTVLRTSLVETPAAVYVPRSRYQDLGAQAYGAALRFAQGGGLLAIVQNPFLDVEYAADSIAVVYRPEMDWDAAWGPFETDVAVLVPHRASGRRLPAAMIPEWRFGMPTADDGMDEAEVAAFTDVVRAFLLTKPATPTNVFVGWCTNDYQIDVATPEGRVEYRRLIDRAAELGADYVLYAPSNSLLSRRDSSVDDWSWEHVLWLGLGQQLRRGEWDSRSSPIPPSVQEMLDHARSRKIRLLAYVYPILPFAVDSGWLVGPADSPSGRRTNLAFRGFQDWLIETLVAFHDRTGVGGFSFDHTFLDLDGASRYAQWRGWRRVLEELRRRIPDVVVDGRQAYHLYGPWSWLAGSYPHPTANDEQPESFVPFPDLHLDRVSADRERYTAYRYRNYEFAPSEIVPGFITHQTPRADEAGRMPAVDSGQGPRLTRFRARDWDYLGWRYSLLSSIAVAGWNNVLNMIPARDSAEFERFSDEDRAFFREWIDWTAAHRAILRRTRTILGQPAFGAIDGTAAMDGDSGYVFLFNPNARRLTARVPLDSSIGLTAGRRLLIRELYPQQRLIGKPRVGTWNRGDTLSVDLEGGSALVLAMDAAPVAFRQPLVFNVSGRAVLGSSVLRLEQVRGVAGTGTDVLVLLPTAAAVTAVTVNGHTAPVAARGTVVATSVQFGGQPFGRLQQIGSYDSSFAGGMWTGRFTIPRRVFDQLAARRRAWPIPWTAADYRSTWLAPERLLLFVQIAEPDDRWEIELAIDGRPVEVRKAYSAVRAVRHTFVGFYADISLLEPEREYTVSLRLPQLEPGRFQGVFFENVEQEYTAAVPLR